MRLKRAGKPVKNAEPPQRDKKMIQTKINLILPIMLTFACLAGSPSWIIIFFDYTNIAPDYVSNIWVNNPHQIGSMGIWFPLILVITLAITVLVVGSICTIKYVFDNRGITLEEKICFFSFTILKYSYSVPWYSIRKVEYYSFSPAGFVFSFPRKGGREGCFCLNFVLKNRKAALTYAVEKLHPTRFTRCAQKKLNKMGIFI